MLCAYHLATAAAMFPVGYAEENEEGSFNEMLRLSREWSPETEDETAAELWLRSLRKYYDELNAEFKETE